MKKSLFIFSLFLSMSLLVVYISNAKSQFSNSSKEGIFDIEVISKNLNHPWALAFLPDGDFLVSERRGKLWKLSLNGEKTEIKNVPAVYHEGQGGLLDVVLKPEFKDGGWVYFSYAAVDENDKDLANTEVARARLHLKKNRLSNIEVIFKALPKVEGGNHWGSRLLISPNEYLYITLGERFDYKEEAQNIDNHLGALIRIHKDGSIPKTNPFIDNENAKDEVYSYGHRNPQGIALHPTTEKIWIHEHGPKGGDEINIIEAGANYGWPKVTFGISYWGTKISDKTTMQGVKDPVLQWTPSIAPSGMAFYTGNKFPEWEGNLFVGALAHKHLRRLELEGDKIVAEYELLKDMGERIRDVRQGPDGYLYILTDEPKGKLIKLDRKS